MALLTYNYYCPKLGMASELRILAPDTCLRGEVEAAGLLFLLPREGENGLSLLTEAGLGTYVEKMNTVIVIPPCLEGCFTDMVYGYPFYQSLKYVREYLGTYLPGLLRKHVKYAVAGYGISAMAALRWAHEEPDFFSAVGVINSLLDPAMEPQGYFTEKRLSNLFGEPEERVRKRDRFLAECHDGTVKNVCYTDRPEDFMKYYEEILLNEGR
ncbi:MAG: hypothetical protein IJL78_06800 [Lachnospiraceae bacterium]|nr:hypothetical protein [Lachnospiraceae bacterium]